MFQHLLVAGFAPQNVSDVKGWRNKITAFLSVRYFYSAASQNRLIIINFRTIKFNNGFSYCFFFSKAKLSCNIWLSHSGDSLAMAFKAKRIDSKTHSNRLIPRTTAKTWVESVRCLPRALSIFRSRHQSSSLLNKEFSAFSATSRARNSHNTVLSKPESSNSKLKMYFQSILARTDSLAARSERFSINWKIVIRASRHGA